MNEEITGRIFQNKNNKQYTIVAIKKNCSKKALELMSDPNVIGFHLKVVEVLTEMPKLKKLTYEEQKAKWRYYNKKRKEKNK